MDTQSTVGSRRPVQNQSAAHDLRITKSDTDQQLCDLTLKVVKAPFTELGARMGAFMYLSALSRARA
ncbi:hypothetical protein BB31_31970 [Amycolatopsis lurida NRRL 2430]|uniref:Uncharacterized protein n=1 Tax=Amycolatopsis lurida NRRL 2430 TaxID=1460371 RepID=A0A2P2FK95_AMYLU|nr:hypothetical protein BB31_31970 [Amycolatopsis lurida NRRL 2430]